MTAVITGIFGLSLAVVLLYLIRKDYLYIANGLQWLIVIAVLCFAGLAPLVFDRLAAMLGILYPPILAIMLGFGLMTIKCFMLDIANTKLRMRYIDLTQKIAILEADIIRLSAK